MSEDSRSDEGQSVGKVAKASKWRVDPRDQHSVEKSLSVAQQGIIFAFIVFVNS